MLTDVVIWNPTSTASRYRTAEVVSVPPNASRQRATRDFTDADYVPVATYLTSGRSLIRLQQRPVEILAAANAAVGTSAGRARAAIELYSSVFNYGSQPAPLLSIHA